MDIKVLRFMTGEELIGDFVEGSDSYKVKTPIRLIFIPEKQSIAFLPAFPFAQEETLKFNKSIVQTVYTPSKEIISQYNSQFGNGLILPTTKGLIVP